MQVTVKYERHSRRQFLRLSRNQENRRFENGIDSYRCELVDSELKGREESRELRMYIDAPVGVNLDDCDPISQQFNRLLDVGDQGKSQSTQLNTLPDEYQTGDDQTLQTE